MALFVYSSILKLSINNILTYQIIKLFIDTLSIP